MSEDAAEAVARLVTLQRLHNVIIEKANSTDLTKHFLMLKLQHVNSSALAFHKYNVHYHSYIHSFWDFYTVPLEDILHQGTYDSFQLNDTGLRLE